MECIYVQELNIFTKSYDVSLAETQHLKALRMQTNDTIMLTNGAGLNAIATIERSSKSDFFVHIINYLPNHGELPHRLAIALGILDNKDRFEFAIEKCVELGVIEIYPLILDFCQHKTINLPRLQTKAITALKQCKRSVLPAIHLPQTLQNIIECITTQAGLYQRIVLADEGGCSANNLANGIDSIVFIGAEGGFSDKEKLLFPTNTLRLDLGNRRLRAETAAIVSIGLLAINS